MTVPAALPPQQPVIPDPAASGEPAATAGGLVLPERLRLPDLSGVRAVTVEDLGEWLEMAEQALRWGPDERNGCRRVLAADQTAWFDASGQVHSPDPWTPARSAFASIAWAQHGHNGQPADQPSTIDPSGLTWWARGQRHRAHAPGVISVLGAPAWVWQRAFAPSGLRDLLDHAWAEQPLDDSAAQALLDRAADLTPRKPLAVTAPAWVAQVLAANDRHDLSTGMRQWLHLLAT